jgi:hypothetical protein
MMNRESKSGNGKDKKIIDELRKSENHSGKDLSGLTLFNLDLSEKDFSKSDLTSTNLSGANLSRCNFSSTNLTDTKLTGALLKGVKFEGTIRDGNQIIKHASISVGDKFHYAFLCQNARSKVILINEENKPEYEYKMGGATAIGSMLVNLLNIG